MGEGRHNLFIDGALEGNDEAGQILHRLPFPGVELGRVATRWRVDGDLAFVTFEAEGKPALRLAAILALQPDADQVFRQVVIDPFRRSAIRLTVFIPVSS